MPTGLLAVLSRYPRTLASVAVAFVAIAGLLTMTPASFAQDGGETSEPTTPDTAVTPDSDAADTADSADGSADADATDTRPMGFDMNARNWAADESGNVRSELILGNVTVDVTLDGSDVASAMRSMNNLSLVNYTVVGRDDAGVPNQVRVTVENQEVGETLDGEPVDVTHPFAELSDEVSKTVVVTVADDGSLRAANEDGSDANPTIAGIAIARVEDLRRPHPLAAAYVGRHDVNEDGAFDAERMIDAGRLIGVAESGTEVATNLISIEPEQSVMVVQIAGGFEVPFTVGTQTGTLRVDNASVARINYETGQLMALTISGVYSSSQTRESAGRTLRIDSAGRLSITYRVSR